MKIEHLREFCLLVEKRSFVQVAKACFVSQSALSKHIQALEQELGVTLFVRTATDVHPTKVGKAFLHYAREIVASHDAALQKVEELRNSSQDIVRVAAYSPHQPIDDIMRLTKMRLGKEWPLLEVEVVMPSPLSPLDAVLAGKADICVTSLPSSVEPSGLVMAPVCDVPWVVVVDKKHRLSGSGRIALDELSGERILWPASPFFNDPYESLKALLAESGVRVEYVPVHHSGMLDLLDMEFTGEVFITDAGSAAHSVPLPLLDEIKILLIDDDRAFVRAHLIHRRGKVRKSVLAVARTMREIALEIPFERYWGLGSA